MEHLTADSISTWNPGDLPVVIQDRSGMRETKIAVFNLTTRAISVSDIRGFMTVHPPVGENDVGFNGRKGVVIKFTDVHDNQSKNDILQLDDSEYTEHNPYLSAQIRELSKNTRKFGSNPRITTTIFIDQIDLFKKRSVLVHAAGMLIKVLPHGYQDHQLKYCVPDHPLSMRALLREEGNRMSAVEAGLLIEDGVSFKRLTDKRESIFTQSMTVIENDGTTYGQLYVRKRAPLADDKFQVAAMVATHDSSMSPGLYVRTNVSSNVALTHDKTFVTYISNPDEFKFYGVYFKMREAQTPDAVELAEITAVNQATQLTIAKERLKLEEDKAKETAKQHERDVMAANTKHEQFQREAELKQQRAEEEHTQAMEVLRAKAEAAAAEAKVLREKLEFERLKEVSEKNAHRRKLVIELIKSAVLFVGGLVTLFKFFKDLWMKVPLKI